MAEGSLSSTASAPTLVVPAYTFRDPILDERRGYLVEIEPSSEVSILVLARGTPVRAGGAWLYYVPIAGPTGGLPLKTTTDPTNTFAASGRTSWYISRYNWPGFLIFLDETGTRRYVTYDSDATGNLVATADIPAGLFLYQGQYIGEYLEFLGGDGVSLYHMTVNSSNVISTVLDRVEPNRAKPVCLSQGVPQAFRQDSTEADRIWIEAVVDVADIEMRLDEVEWGYGGTFVPRTGNMTVSIGADTPTGRYELDWLVTQKWDTRKVTIWSGSITDDLANWPVIFRGQTQTADADEDLLRITMRDYGIFFDRPVQSNTYAGTGLVEGPQELRGTPKPLAFGPCQVVTPALIDPVNNIYQVHDGEIGNVDFVWDRGVLLSSTGAITQPALQLENLWAWQPSAAFAGTYLMDRGRGMFRLAAPPEGQVTSRVASSIVVAPYGQNIGAIVRAIALRALPEIPIDEGAFDAFIKRVPDEAHIYISQERTVRDVFHELLAPVGGFVGINRFGQLTIRLLEAGVAKHHIKQGDIEDNSVISRRQAPQAGKQYRYGHDRINTVQTDTDLSTNDQFYRSRVANAYRYTQFTFPEPYLRYESAKLITIESTLNLTPSAQYFTNFIVGRHQVMRHIYELAVAGYQFQIDLGDTVTLQYERFDLNVPKTGLVVGVHERVNDGVTHLTLWI